MLRMPGQMAIRAMILTDSLDARRSVLWGALAQCSAAIEVRTLRLGSSLGELPRADGACMTAGKDDEAGVRSRSGGRPRSDAAVAAVLAHLPFGPAMQLAAYRPDLVISEGFDTPALQAALYRSASRNSRFLLCATEPPQRFGLRERAILGMADGVLADGEAVAHAVEQLRFPASRIFPVSAPYDVEAFLGCRRTRSGPEAHRLVFAGELSPQSGAADLLIALAAWAEQHPGRPVEIWWVGEGDLSGVLEAQPLPDTMSQRFLGRLGAAETAGAFEQCGLLAVPSLADDRMSPIPEALAAGLPVLGSRRNRKVRQLVRDGVNGWLFDPLQPAEMLRALDLALGSPPETLDQMQERGRALLRPAASQGFADLIRKAVAAVLPEPQPHPAP